MQKTITDVILVIFCNYTIFVHVPVSKYTREAGVRTLERRIGAVCRAVAVKVAEHSLKKGVNLSAKADLAKTKDDNRRHKMKDKETLVDAVEMVLPPEMPIIIDEQAVEDILGVRNFVRLSVFKKNILRIPHFSQSISSFIFNEDILAILQKGKVMERHGKYHYI